VNPNLTPSKILVVQPAYTGDVVLATPVLERLHRVFPGAEIHFLLRKGNEGLLKGHPFVQKLFVRDKGKGKLKELWRLLKQIRAERYDVVVNLHRYSSSGLLAVFSGAKHICGFDKNPFSFLYHRQVQHRIGDGTHEVARNLTVVEHFTDQQQDSIRLYPSTIDRETIKRDRPYVCIAPTSVWFTKQWPEKKWMELIDSLPTSLDVLLLGGPTDQAACNRIKGGVSHTNVETMAGRLTMLQSVALMEGATMNFVNDSAPLHFASATNAPVTAVFLSTVPHFGFGPTGSRGSTVETTKSLSCRPCGLHGFKSCPEGHFECSNIPVEMLLNTLDGAVKD